MKRYTTNTPKVTGVTGNRLLCTMCIPTYESDKEMLQDMGKVLNAMTTLFDNKWTLDLYCKVRKEEPEDYRKKRRALIHKIAREMEMLADCKCKETVEKTDTRIDVGEVGFLRETQTLLHVRLTACPRPPPPPSQCADPTIEEYINGLIAQTPLA